MALLIWTERALEDIENIAEFISKDSEKYAKIQVQKFFKSAESLQSNCKIGRIVPELNRKEIRELILGNYRLIYRIVSDEQIDIISVHHSYRLLKNNPAFKNKK